MDAAGFVTELHALGLLDDAGLNNSVRELTERPLSAPDLAQELVRRNLLTSFQAGHLLTGKGRNLVLGPYRFLESVTAHARGRVFRAVHAPLGRVVAVKLMRCPSGRRLAVRARFERETTLAARLTHPNLVTALDAFENDGLYVLVTEWVPGTDLRGHVRASGRLSVPTACGFAMQAALALQHTHERGLLHQTVEPGNLLIAEPPASPSLADIDLARTGLTCRPLKLLNLGQSWLAARRSRSPEGALSAGDHANYLAPEQFHDRPDLDQRSDLYGLGACLYFALAGRPPRRPGKADGARGEVVPLEKLRPDVPSRLAAIVRRLLAARPADRFESAEEVVQVLMPFCVTVAPRASSPHLNTAVGQQTTLADVRGGFTSPALSLKAKPGHPGPLPPRRWGRSAVRLVLAAMGCGFGAALLLHLLRLLGELGG